MSSIAESYNDVTAHLRDVCRDFDRLVDDVTLVAVSKTHSVEAIQETIALGHRVFAENRVQEAQSKWPLLRQELPDLELRLIGPLQSNKAAYAVGLFDVIETVDRVKIARAIAKEMVRQNRKPRLFVQVNTGLEPQKAGVTPIETSDFVDFCTSELDLSIDGLMCIPPDGENPGPHFALLRKLARDSQLRHLSMGMSGDYQTAVQFGATSIRVGSAIFGARAKTR